MRKTFLAAGALLCLSLSVSAQVKLTFNPDKGATYLYTSESNSEVKQNIMGQDFDMKQSMRMSMEMKIADKTATAISEEITFKSMKLEIESPMFSLGYDSENPNKSYGEYDGIIKSILGAMPGKKFTAKLGTDGSVTSVDGMQAIVEEMTKAVAGDQMGEMLVPQLAGNFSDEAMKAQLEQNSKIYPAKSVKAGDTWTNKLNGNASGGVDYTIDITYTLKSTDAKQSVIEWKGTMSSNTQLSITMNGTTTLDTKTGVPVQIDYTLVTKGTVSAEGMDVEMSNTAKNKITYVKL
ncbi:MAG: DUF6263 family protein [Prevotellaceae bacterium]|jgi:hypothetical protein|nr:DUF6263 family protein [Prevotellaceae bacterium]